MIGFLKVDLKSKQQRMQMPAEANDD